jgi:hypothetical protein
LVRLGFTAVELRINPFLNSGFPEDVMASGRPLDKAQAKHQPAKIGEPDVGVRSAT